MLTGLVLVDSSSEGLIPSDPANVGESVQMAASPPSKSFADKIKAMRDAVLKGITVVDKLHKDIDAIANPIVTKSMDAKVKGKAADALQGSLHVAQLSPVEPEEVHSLK